MSNTENSKVYYGAFFKCNVTNTNEKVVSMVRCTCGQIYDTNAHLIIYCSKCGIKIEDKQKLFIFRMTEAPSFKKVQTELHQCFNLPFAGSRQHCCHLYYKNNLKTVSMFELVDFQQMKDDILELKNKYHSMHKKLIEIYGKENVSIKWGILIQSE